MTNTEINPTIKTFTYLTDTVRVATRDGEPWFVLTDVCKVLEIGNPSDAARRLDEDEKDTLDNIESIKSCIDARAQSAVIVNESGLYSLILTSRKPEAKRFKKWVTRDVLPAIRKDGGYILGEEKVKTGELSEDELVLRALTVMKTKIARLEAEKAEVEEVVHEHLEMVTVDEWRALHHIYLEPVVSRHLGSRSKKLHRAAGIETTKQFRVYTDKDGVKHDSDLNVYRMDLVDEAARQIGIKFTPVNFIRATRSNIANTTAAH